MPLKRKAATTKKSSPVPTTKKSTSTASKKKKAAPPPSSSDSDSDSDSESDSNARPPPAKKSKPAPKAKAPAATRKKAPTPSTAAGKGKGKGKSEAQEVLVLDSSDDDDDEAQRGKLAASESDGDQVRPSTSKAKSTSKSKSPAKPKKTAAPVANKSKSKSRIVLESDDESDVQDTVGKKKKRASIAKKADSKSSKAKLKANSPPTPAEHSPAPSTSTVSAKPKSKKPVKVSPPKPLTFEEVLKSWFSRFAEHDEEAQGQEVEEDKLAMGGEGIEKLFDEMGLAIDGIHPLLLAWKVDAKPGSFGTFTYEDFKVALKPLDIRTSTALASHLEATKATLYSEFDELDPTSKQAFSSFYQFLFPFLKEDGQKSLPPGTAIAVLDLVLGPKYELGKQFVEFATDQGEKFKSVSLDVWTQLYEFVEAVGPDLDGWSEMDAWPSTIDQFVEWKQAKDATK
ncbi:hypothetical protein JCM11491_004979 [Sporobolomyces phaffii]